MFKYISVRRLISQKDNIFSGVKKIPKQYWQGTSSLVNIKETEVSYLNKFLYIYSLINVEKDNCSENWKFKAHQSL